MLDYDDADRPVRPDLAEAHRRAWLRIGRPGTWYDGATRVAIASEARRAMTCRLCAERREALSPYGVDGAHDGDGVLPDDMVDSIHRIRTDAARLTRSWYDRLVAEGMGDAAYAELVGVVITTVAVDTFCRAIGVPPRPLPAPAPGEPSRYRPAGLRHDGAWLPMIAPEDAAPEETDLYPGGRAMYTKRALSIVPDEVRGFFDLVQVHYLTADQQWRFRERHRALDNAQIELVAARVSVLNNCTY